MFSVSLIVMYACFGGEIPVVVCRSILSSDNIVLVSVEVVASHGFCLVLVATVDLPFWGQECVLSM